MEIQGWDALSSEDGAYILRAQLAFSIYGTFLNAYLFHVVTFCVRDWTFEYQDQGIQCTIL